MSSFESPSRRGRAHLRQHRGARCGTTRRPRPLGVARRRHHHHHGRARRDRRAPRRRRCGRGGGSALRARRPRDLNQLRVTAADQQTSLDAIRDAVAAEQARLRRVVVDRTHSKICSRRHRHDRREIFDRGYRTFDGERAGVGKAVRSVAWHTIRSILGLGRKGRHKVFPIIVAVVAFLPRSASRPVRAHRRPDGGELQPEYWELFGLPIVAVMLSPHWSRRRRSFAIAATACCGSISPHHSLRRRT